MEGKRVRREGKSACVSEVKAKPVGVGADGIENGRGGGGGGGGGG